jgi:hypothetical protein
VRRIRGRATKKAVKRKVRPFCPDIGSHKIFFPDITIPNFLSRCVELGLF